MRNRYVFVAFVLLGLVVAPTAAAINPSIVGWEDNDYETIFDRDSNGVLSDGDLIVGMWQIQKVGPANTDSSTWPATGQYVAVYVQEVKNVVAGGLYSGIGGSRITFGPTAFVDTADVDGLDDTWESYGLKRTGLGTMAVVYSDKGAVPQILADVDGLGPSYEGTIIPAFAPPPAFAPGATIILDELQTAQDGTMLWEVGFTGLGENPVGPMEFWVADVSSTTIPPIGGMALNYVASGNATVVGAGGPTVAHDYFSADGTYLLWNLVTGGLPTFSQWQLEGSLTTSPGDFHLATDSNIYYQPVPEPTSALVFLGLAGLALVGGVVRREKR